MQIKPKFPRFCGSVRYRNAGRLPDAYKSSDELEEMLAESMPLDREIDPILIFGKSVHREIESLFDPARTAAFDGRADCPPEIRDVKPCIRADRGADSRSEKIRELIAAAVVFFAETSVFSAPLSYLWTRGQHFGLCWQGCLIFAATLLLSLKWKISPVWILIGSAVVSWLLFLF